MSAAAKPSRRACLFGGAAALPAGGAAVRLAGAAAHDDPDAELLRLAAELRAAEEAWRAAAVRMDDPDDAGAEDGADAASEAVEELLRRMAAAPARGLSGIAAKAGRLTCSLSDTATIMGAERPLAASLAVDLARLAPQAVAPVAGAVGPAADEHLVRSLCRDLLG